MVQSITATTDIQNKSYSDVEVHVEHKEFDKNGLRIKHSNKEIDFNRTKYNEKILDKNLDKIEEELFGDEFEKYNEKRIKSGHANEVKKNIKEYVKSKNGVFNKRGIVTFGNSEIFKNGIENMNPSHAKIVNSMFEIWTNNFNKTFENLEITKATTHLDESTPHMHFELIGKARTGKKNNVSLNINQSIKKEYERITGDKPPRDTRIAMRWFRRQTDEMLIDAYNQSKNFDQNNDKRMVLARTGNHIAKDQESFKKIKDERKKISNEKKKFTCEMIREYEPEARITYKFANPLNPNSKPEQSEPIKEPEGFKAFMRQNLNWLKKERDKYKKEFWSKIKNIKEEYTEMKNNLKKLNGPIEEPLKPEIYKEEYPGKLKAYYAERKRRSDALIKQTNENMWARNSKKSVVERKGPSM